MATHWIRPLVVLAFICAGLSGASSVAAAPHSSPPFMAAGERHQGQDGMLPPGDVPPSAPPDDAHTGQDQDQDGMLPDGQTPDDDGDGVVDADDSAPDDPNKGEAPAPGPTDPVADSDGDGLPNMMDPDDNNNGLPDADEGVGSVDDIDPAPVPVTDSPAAVDPVAGGSAASDAQPLVLALPSTGTGAEDTPLSIPMLLAGGTLLLLASGISLRSRRP